MNATTHTPRTAWALIGWDDGAIKIASGRVTYDAVAFNDSTPGDRVRLDRIVVRDGGLAVVNRYVDADTLLVPADDDARANWGES